MSTTQWCKEVIEAGTEAVDPEDGSMMCRSWWLFTDTEDMTFAAKADVFCSDSIESSVLPTETAGTEVGTTSGLCCCKIRSGSFNGVEG